MGKTGGRVGFLVHGDYNEFDGVVATSKTAEQDAIDLADKLASTPAWALEMLARAAKLALEAK